MSKKQKLASFCRLCLVKTTNKVPVFGSEEENVTNLLALIELNIHPELESDAVLCFDCIVTLEGFLQFKHQCHVNDEFLKTLPPKSSTEASIGSDEEDADTEDVLNSEVAYDSEEEGLVEDVDLDAPSVASVNPEPEVGHRKSHRVRKPTAKALASPINALEVATTPKPDPKPTPKRQKVDPSEVREPAANELPKLRESYPDYFHFERGPRSVHYNLIFYGERYNSAIFAARNTYWQCAFRRKYRCPAMVYASNDYVSFERRYEHTHGELKEMGEFDLFTPKQVLPELFRICWKKVMEKKVKRQTKNNQNVMDKVGEKNPATDDEIEFLDDYEKGPLENALRKSGVLVDDDDDDDDD